MQIPGTITGQFASFFNHLHACRHADSQVNQIIVVVDIADLVKCGYHQRAAEAPGYET